MAKPHLISPIIIIISTLATCQNNTTSQTSVLEEPCEKLPRKYIDGYIGFPLTIPYDSIFKYKLSLISKQNGTAGKNFTCTVTAIPSGKVLNETQFRPFPIFFRSPMKIAYRIPKVSNESATNYTIKCALPRNSTTIKEAAMSEHTCAQYDVSLLVKNLLSPDCGGTPIKDDNRTIEKNNLSSFTCGVPALKDIPHQWKRIENGKCTDNFGSGIRIDNKTNSLQLPNPDFHHAGIYVCIVKSEGKNLIVQRYNVCIAYMFVPTEHIKVLCSTKSVKIGEDALITCTTDLSTSLKIGKVKASWFKIQRNDTDSVCYNELSAKEKSQTHFSRGTEKFNCSQASSIPEVKCYHSAPKEQAPHDIRTFNLTIKNVNKSDFGLYQLNIMPDGLPHRYKNITLTENKADETRQAVIRIAIPIICCVVVICFVLLAFYMKMDIKWFYKKHFGHYEKVAFPYMAHLLYYYDVEKQEGETMKKTKTLVSNVHTFMDKFGGTVYDEQRDPSLHQYDTYNIAQVQSECHRIIVILSPEFVIDEWSRHAAYKAIHAVIEEGKKIVFISMPETKEAISKIETEPGTTLKLAMKRNMTIKWNGKSPLTKKFKRRLEFSMPKLEKPNLNRYLSDSSQAQLTKQNGQSKPNVEMSSISQKDGIDNLAVA